MFESVCGRFHCGIVAADAAAASSSSAGEREDRLILANLRTGYIDLQLYLGLILEFTIFSCTLRHWIGELRTGGKVRENLLRQGILLDVFGQSANREYTCINACGCVCVCVGFLSGWYKTRP